MSRSSYTQTITQLLCSWSQEQTRKVRREGFAAGRVQSGNDNSSSHNSNNNNNNAKTTKKQRCDSKTIAWFSSFSILHDLAGCIWKPNRLISSRQSQLGDEHAWIFPTPYSLHDFPVVFTFNTEDNISSILDPVVWDEMRHWTSRGVAVTNKLDELEGRPMPWESCSILVQRDLDNFLRILWIYHFSFIFMVDIILEYTRYITYNFVFHIMYTLNFCLVRWCCKRHFL